ncbi:MAG: hypothetical protein ACK4WB_03725, partial [Desulfatiglandales bacterium]
MSIEDKDLKIMVLSDMDIKKLFFENTSTDQKLMDEVKRRLFKIQYEAFLAAEDIIDFFKYYSSDEIPEQILQELLFISKDQYAQKYWSLKNGAEIELNELKSFFEINRYFQELINKWSKDPRYIFYSFLLQIYLLKEDLFQDKDSIIKNIEDTVKNFFTLSDTQKIQKITDELLGIIQTLPKGLGLIHIMEIILAESKARGQAEIYKRYIHLYSREGFIPPSFQGFSDDWQPIYNHGHPTSLKRYIEQIQAYPEEYEVLLKALIVHIGLKGVFIRDTDLFGPYITKLIQSTPKSHFWLLIRLLKQLPVFYNEIGAEGEIRDISTEIDEIEKRNDILIHFLRKHCHVLSNSQTPEFLKAILRYWITDDPRLLKKFLPPEIFSRIQNNTSFAQEYKAILKTILNKINAS